MVDDVASFVGFALAVIAAAFVLFMLLLAWRIGRADRGPKLHVRQWIIWIVVLIAGAIVAVTCGFGGNHGLPYPDF